MTAFAKKGSAMGLAAFASCGLIWTGSAGAAGQAPAHTTLQSESLTNLVVSLKVPTTQAEPTPEPTPPAPAPPPPPPPAITPEELARMNLPTEYTAPLNDAMTKAGIDNPVRQAAFISQITVESASFATFEEYASGAAYEGRADLGNTQPGDGVRFKGRGAIQVTGRHNYESVSAFMGVDFVNHPELMEQPEYAFGTAAWYWQSRNLNAVAETAGIEQVSRAVNGGTNGLPQRIDVFHKAIEELTKG